MSKNPTIFFFFVILFYSVYSKKWAQGSQQKKIYWDSHFSPCFRGLLFFLSTNTLKWCDFSNFEIDFIFLARSLVNENRKLGHFSHHLSVLGELGERIWREFQFQYFTKKKISAHFFFTLSFFFITTLIKARIDLMQFHSRKFILKASNSLAFAPRENHNRLASLKSHSLRIFTHKFNRQNFPVSSSLYVKITNSSAHSMRFSRSPTRFLTRFFGVHSPRWASKLAVKLPLMRLHSPLCTLRMEKMRKFVRILSFPFSFLFQLVSSITFFSSSRRSARLFDRAFVQSSFSFDRDCVLVSTNLVRNESSSTGICARVLPIHMRIFCFEKFFERSDRFFFLIISLLSFQLLWGGKSDAKWSCWLTLKLTCSWISLLWNICWILLLLLLTGTSWISAHFVEFDYLSALRCCVWFFRYVDGLCSAQVAAVLCRTHGINGDVTQNF